MSAFDAAVEKAARAMVPPTVDPDRPHGTGKFEAPMWTFYVDDANAALEAVGLPALLEDNGQLRVSVNRQFGEPLDEVYKTDGITIVMQQIHDLRRDHDALAAKLADVRTVLAEIDGYGWNTGRAVRLRAALTGAAS